MLPSLRLVANALAALRGSPLASPSAHAELEAAHDLIEANATSSLGPPPQGHHTRIIVTAPSEAATDPALVRGFLQGGMQLLRINAAHDMGGAAAMVAHLRAAQAATGLHCLVQVDLAGPKLRTGPMPEEKGKKKRQQQVLNGSLKKLLKKGGGGPGNPKSRKPGLTLRPGDTLEVNLGDSPCREPKKEGGDFVISVPVPEVFSAVVPGHSLLLDDGKFVGKVLETGPGRFRAQLTHVAGGKAKLGAEKGVNLPDTRLQLPALTVTDHEDLAQALKLKPDAIALSFVQTEADVTQLQGLLDASPAGRGCAIYLKIETATAFENLPSLLLAAMRRPKFAVMVARGDLGVEVGFARLSEVQEEIMWLCEAAHAPAIWATQVLESMAKTGLPSRGDVTDVASAGRAEACMLNKGPYMTAVLALLNDVLTRMAAHERKRMHLKRRLQVAITGPRTVAGSNN